MVGQVTQPVQFAGMTQSASARLHRRRTARRARRTATRTPKQSRAAPISPKRRVLQKRCALCQNGAFLHLLDLFLERRNFNFASARPPFKNAHPVFCHFFISSAVIFLRFSDRSIFSFPNAHRARLNRHRHRWRRPRRKRARRHRLMAPMSRTRTLLRAAHLPRLSPPMPTPMPRPRPRRVPHPLARRSRQRCPQ